MTAEGFDNAHDMIAYASNWTPATWAGAIDEALLVSYWIDEPLGVGLALQRSDGIVSVGMTVAEARAVANLLLSAAAEVEHIEAS